MYENFAKFLTLCILILIGKRECCHFFVLLGLKSWSQFIENVLVEAVKIGNQLSRKEKKRKPTYFGDKND